MLIYVQMECLNVMVTGCLCVCGVLDDVSMSAITALADVIISGKLVATDVPAVVMALFVVLCLHLPNVTQWLTL